MHRVSPPGERLFVSGEQRAHRRPVRAVAERSESIRASTRDPVRGEPGQSRHAASRTLLVSSSMTVSEEGESRTRAHQVKPIEVVVRVRRRRVQIGPHRTGARRVAETS